MDMVDIFFGLTLIVSIGYLIWLGVKESMETKRLENTPIDVYKYTYKIYLRDGSHYEKVVNFYVNYSFYDFVKWDIFHKDSLKINNSLVINTNQIIKIELVEAKHKSIKPILNHFGVDSVYTDEEVLEREVN